MTDGRVDLGDREGGRSLWERIVDVALTDVETLVRGVDGETIGELERLLLEADFGVDATLELVEGLERAARRGDATSREELRERLAAGIRSILEEAREGSAAGRGAPGTGPPGAAAGDDRRGGSPELRRAAEGPTVVLLVGVNGTGKTTTAAKLAHRYAGGGEGAVIAATDTFRAAAQEQARIWAERLGARFVGGEEGGDPAAVAYDAVEAAEAGGQELVVVDTAGRLHTRGDLMEELQKIDRVVGRLRADAPHERLLVADATSGQNVLRQAREFGRSLELTGLVLAKYDSTARGGAAVAVAREAGLPVRWLGTGEEPADLEPFDPARFADRVLEGG